LAATDRKVKGNDRLADTEGRPLVPSSLLGSYFHSIIDCPSGKHRIVQWQGCVVGEPHPGFYLVETFDWIIGASHSQSLVRIEDMTEWVFYDTSEWMVTAYSDRGDPCRGSAECGR
jgi:hypothetical protein